MILSIWHVSTSDLVIKAHHFHMLDVTSDLQAGRLDEVHNKA